MSFDWSNFIKLADDLLKSVDENNFPTNIRTAINRSYYGVLGLARNLYMFKKIGTKPVDIKHGDIIDIYRTSDNGDARKIGNNMGNLYKDRWDADYKDDANFTHTEAKCDFDDANESVKLLDTLRANKRFHFT